MGIKYVHWDLRVVLEAQIMYEVWFQAMFYPCTCKLTSFLERVMADFVLYKLWFNHMFFTVIWWFWIVTVLFSLTNALLRWLARILYKGEKWVYSLEYTIFFTHLMLKYLNSFIHFMSMLDCSLLFLTCIWMQYLF